MAVTYTVTLLSLSSYAHVVPFIQLASVTPQIDPNMESIPYRIYHGLVTLGEKKSRVQYLREAEWMTVSYCSDDYFSCFIEYSCLCVTL
jgi:hypothetical protein